jgi:VIT1/CCC1 family predicted Fe2+/Mn2+ transporter
MHHVERHGQWTNGAARAAVFGVSDGLVSNLALVAGVAGASSSRGDVIVGGVAGLAAGALSMAVGEYVSVKANREFLERELQIERLEIERDPTGEARELAGIYLQRGLDLDTARLVSEKMMADPKTALEAHARDELGVDPDQLGAPVTAALASLASFACGAAVPLVPWLMTSGGPALIASLVLAVLVAAGLGSGIAAFTRRSIARGAARQVLLLLAVFVVTTAIGRLVGGVI